MTEAKQKLLEVIFDTKNPAYIQRLTDALEDFETEARDKGFEYGVDSVFVHMQTPKEISTKVKEQIYLYKRAV